jgi:hypothetical protein
VSRTWGASEDANAASCSRRVAIDVTREAISISPWRIGLTKLPRGGPRAPAVLMSGVGSPFAVPGSSVPASPRTRSRPHRSRAAAGPARRSRRAHRPEVERRRRSRARDIHGLRTRDGVSSSAWKIGLTKLPRGGPLQTTEVRRISSPARWPVS